MVKIEGYNSNQNSVYRLNYHFAWSTRLKLKVFSPSLTDNLRKIIQEICNKEKYEILSLEIQPETVQLIITLPPKESPSIAIKKIKGITARKLFLRYPELKHSLLLGSLWNNNYFVGSIGSVTTKSITEYFDKQKKVSISL